VSDLILVPMKDLIQELFNRTECCVVAYTRTIDDGCPIIQVSHSDSNNLQKLGLCEMIKHDLIVQAHEE